MYVRAILHRPARSFLGSWSLQVSWDIIYTGGPIARPSSCAARWRPGWYGKMRTNILMCDLCCTRHRGVTRKKDETRVTGLSTQIGRLAVVGQQKDDWNRSSLNTCVTLVCVHVCVTTTWSVVNPVALDHLNLSANTKHLNHLFVGVF